MNRIKTHSNSTSFHNIRRYKGFIFLLFSIPIFTSSSYTSIEKNLNTSQILTDFYNSMGGNDWINNAGWGTNSDPCTWYGINCFSSGEVSMVLLSNNNLVGTLSESNSLCDLPSLGDLDLSNNSIDGTLPACLFGGTLDFNISNNMIGGELPASFKDINNFGIINVSNNQLTGCYPNAFAPLCNTYLSNSIVSDGNNFDASWSEYCNEGEGVCCENIYEITLDTLESGTYYAAKEIKLSGNLASSKTIKLKTRTAIIDNPNFVTNTGNIEIDPNGCDDENALHFDGDNDWVQVTGYVTPPSFSVSFWYKGNDYISAAEGRIFSIAGVTFDQMSIGFREDPPFNLWYNHPVDNTGTLQYSVLDDQWHYFVLTVSPSGDKLYFDGSKVADLSSSSSPGYNQYFRLGRWIGGGSGWTQVKGRIDEFRMYNIALDETDVFDQYNCNIYNYEDNVDIYLNFNEGLAYEDNNGITEIINQQGNSAYNATMNNFTLMDSVSNFVNPLEIIVDECCDASFTTQCLKVIAPLDENSEVELMAEDFDSGTTLSCDDSFTISFDQEGVITSQIFDCDNVGLQTITIYYLSEGGILDTCEAMLLIQDMDDVCP